jgi:signal transduction histidine kinase
MNEMACALFRMPSVGDELAESQVNLLHASRLALSGQLLSAILHEMHQPLTAVRLRAKNGRDLLAAGASPEAIDEIFRDIETSVVLATDIAKRLRLLSNKRPLELAPIDLNDAVRELAGLARIQADAREARLELILEPELPPLWADRVSIQHAVLDLAMNGLEALEPDGERVVTIETRIAGWSLEIRVSDTGPGIALANRKKLFQPFFTTKAEGTGLGLAIARSLVEAHGGALDAERRRGPGACFCIRLPLLRDLNQA